MKYLKIKLIIRRKIIKKTLVFFDFCLCFFIFYCVYDLMLFLRFFNKTSQHNFVERVFLYMMSKDILLKGDILEIGSFRGGSAVALALGNESSKLKGKVWLIEPLPLPNKEIFLNKFKKYILNKSLELIDKTSEEAIHLVNSQFKFMFIDGNHGYKYVKQDFLLWQDYLIEGGIIAFHDYHLNEVSNAIEELMLDFDKFTPIGTVGSIFYASKGNFDNQSMLLKLRKINNIRQKLIHIAKKLRLLKIVGYSGIEPVEIVI